MKDLIGHSWALMVRATYTAATSSSCTDGQEVPGRKGRVAVGTLVSWFLCMSSPSSARRKARCPYERPARQPGIAVLDL